MESEEFNPVDEQKTKKNHGKKVMMILAIILVIAVLAIVMVMANRNPEAIFEKQIDELLTYEETANYETIKMNMDLQMNIEGGEINEFTDLINDAKISFHIEKDNQTQEELYGIALTKDSQELLDAKAKLDSKAQKLYINLGRLFDQTIEMDRSEMFDETSEVSEPLNFMQLMNAKKAEMILKREVKQQLKSEYFSSEKTTIDDKKLTKNILTMSGEELKDFVKNVATNLSQNDEFINCFEDGQELKDSLEELNSEIEDSEISDDINFEIDLYTNGMFSSIQRVDFVITQEEKTVSIQLTKIAKAEYNYELFSNAEKVLEGTIKIQTEEEHTEVEVTAKMDDTTVRVKVSGDVKYDEELSKFDMENIVSSENLSMEDMMELYNNFMQSGFYDFIEGLSSVGSQTNLYDSPLSNNTSKTEVNVLKSYNDELVKFNIPDGFEAYSSDSASYKLFEKEQEDEKIDVSVSVRYESLEEYIDSLKSSLEYFDTEDYSDLKISEVEEVQVNGKTFKKVDISYEYEGFNDEMISYKQSYYAHSLDAENLFTVEIEGSDLMQQEEIDAFLTIE